MNKQEAQGLQEAQAEFMKLVNSPNQEQSSTPITPTPKTNEKITHEVITPEPEPAPQIKAGLTKVYSHHSFADFCKVPAPIRYLIKGYIQEQALHMIFGEPGSGKSFIAIDMAASIACSEITSWHDKTLNHKPVIYLAGEGAAGLKKRCAGWAAKNGVDPEHVQLDFIDEVFPLDGESEEYSIENTIANIRALQPDPGVIFIDTLHTFMNGDENKAQDVAKMLMVCRKLIRELKCAVVLIHHVGVSKEAKNRARGSSSLKGAMDIECQVTKSGDKVTLKQTKNKEAQAEKSLAFTLEEVIIPLYDNFKDWYDEEGKGITTCTLKLDDTATNTTDNPKQEQKINASEKTAKSSYIEAIKRHGVRIKGEATEEEVVAVSVEEWRESFDEISTAEAKSKRTLHYRARKLLVEERELLYKKIIEGSEYYCLKLEGQTETDFRLKASRALKQHESETGATAQTPPKNETEETNEDTTLNMF